MKKVYKVLLGLIALIVICVLLLGTYVSCFLPRIPEAQTLTIESSTSRLARGHYLAHHVAVCMDCHSSRDWTRFAAPLSGNLGGGGERFSADMGFPGDIYSPNITPYNLGSWTDGEIFRAITTGVNKGGEALFPVMPYHHYGQMAQEDVYSIIAYLRSLASVPTSTPARELDFPVNFLVNTMPTESHLSILPHEKDQLAYGAYLVNTAGCVDCHSKTDKGSVIAGTEFGGGMEFKQPAGIVRAPNITMDAKTGIGNWSKEIFVQRFKHYADSTIQAPVLKATDLNSPMPWYMYAGMKEVDLEAIYAYLESLEPIDHLVVRYQPTK